MGVAHSGLWDPVLMGHVVHLVHFVLVVLGQKKIGQQIGQKNPTEKLDKSQTRNRRINRTK